MDGMPFTLRFLFGANDRLLRCVAVTLADNSKAGQFRSTLLTIYGQPISSKKNSLMEQLTWEHDDQVSYSQLIDHHLVTYCSRRNRGL